MVQHIDEYLEVIGREHTEDFIYDLPTLYSFLKDRRDQFLEANRRIYHQPSGFHLVLNQPTCCPHHIRIGYGREMIKIFI